MPAAETPRSTPGAPRWAGPLSTSASPSISADVLYGNIGTARRLDFTVVGPAVNELSRMEALGKALGRGLLLSESIAHRCDQPVLSIGPHELRGVAGSREMYVVAV